MGVNIHTYVVHGYYFKEGDLTQEELEQILDGDLGDPLLVDPMDKNDFIIGDILVESNDGRYDMMHFDPFKFQDLEFPSKYEIRQRVPEVIRDRANDDNFGTYCFICYS